METRIYISEKIKRVYPSLEMNTLPDKVDMELHNNSWNANFSTIENKKCWMITHTKTRYTVVIPDVTAKKIKDLRYWFIDQIINQYLKDNGRINFIENVDPNQFENFFGHFKFYSTNNDKSCIAYLNRRIEDLEWRKYNDGYDGIPFYQFGALINHIGSMKRNGKTEHIQPVKEMLELIKTSV
jgi:hypothetical protein